MQVWIDRYLEWMQVTNYSKNTVHKRGWDLQFFDRWCQERAIELPQDVTKPILESYQRYLYYYRKARDGQPLSFSHQRKLLTSVRSFFKWLTQQNHILYNPASELVLPKTNKRLPVVLNDVEVEQVLAQADLDEPLGLRDRAIMEVFYSTGIRRSELAQLSLYDVDTIREVLSIHGKGGTDRMVPIGERALSWVTRYLEEVRPELLLDMNESTLFLNYQGHSISPDSLSFIVRQYLKRSGLNKTGGCHLFRHSVATIMLENGADIRFIQELLGHVSLKSTQIYTRVSIRKLKEIHNATHPAARIKGDE